MEKEKVKAVAMAREREEGERGGDRGRPQRKVRKDGGASKTPDPTSDFSLPSKDTPPPRRERHLDVPPLTSLPRCSPCHFLIHPWKRIQQKKTQSREVNSRGWEVNHPTVSSRNPRMPQHTRRFFPADLFRAIGQFATPPGPRGQHRPQCGLQE